ncbi:probable polygalacturonase isoform X2 [Macadamia integrifolia]|uniref:probable polygalacturonase isoform X2 n=1 Tax=Macadamia integrifolia TaxID=60698 RepID=UPI001C531EF8|nr:probable polygalacturonase isoform X2 [Macadamia integrifolia]
MLLLISIKSTLKLCFPFDFRFWVQLGFCLRRQLGVIVPRRRADPSHMRRFITLVEVVLVLASVGEAPWVVMGSSHCKQTSTREVRPHSVTITEFGAVGDGVTLNTKAFQNALFYLNSFADKGGAQLFVPAGRWLTGSFDLISHLTLLLHNDAVILGSMHSYDWPVVDPLPSYGRGRELPGGRHRSLIYGRNLTDVVITGDNGTIDGQGSVWWNWFNNGTLNYTRPHLVELMNSTGVVISNLTFLNSPFWTIHPIYCSQVLVQNVTIVAPLDSPNTDGVDPDCYISTGDDLISIKSGWDEYGISFARPSSNIIIRNITGETLSSSGVAIGSEMSGGVSEVYAVGLNFFNSNTGIRIKTSPGRGGYVRNIYFSDITLTNVKTAIKFTGQYGEHPDEFYDPKALPIIDKITIKDIRGDNIRTAGLLEGIEGDNFFNICLSNITLNVTTATPWNCSYVQGFSDLVSPEACEPLREKISPQYSSACYHLSNHLRCPIDRNKSTWLL